VGPEKRRIAAVVDNRLHPEQYQPHGVEQNGILLYGARAKVGLIAGGSTPFVLLTVPTGVILCTAGVIFGPELGQKLAKLLY
jgi:hypothetical protein